MPLTFCPHFFALHTSRLALCAVCPGYKLCHALTSHRTPSTPEPFTLGLMLSILNPEPCALLTLTCNLQPCLLSTMCCVHRRKPCTPAPYLLHILTCNLQP